MVHLILNLWNQVTLLVGNSFHVSQPWSGLIATWLIVAILLLVVIILSGELVNDFADMVAAVVISAGWPVIMVIILYEWTYFMVKTRPLLVMQALGGTTNKEDKDLKDRFKF